MIATNATLDAAADILAADATTLAPAVNGLHVHIIAAAFVPGPATDFTALTEAAFTGSAAKTAGTGACARFTNPLTGQRAIELNEPVGGWRWKCTVAPGAPEVIQGYAVTDNGDAVTFGSALLPQSVTIQAVNDAVEVPYVRFEVQSSALNGYAA